MCGRFTLRTPMQRLAEQFVFEWHEGSASPRFNIAPSQQVAAVRRPGPDDGRQLAWLKWGLVPSWARDPAIGNRLINARGETAVGKPSFRSAFRRRRCLVLADGYYEWRKAAAGGRKQPFYFTMKDDRPFAMAGLWETATGADGQPLESCTIITTAANELAEPIHHRMPVVLPATAYDAWLDPSNGDVDTLNALLVAYPAERMGARPVNTIVNNPRNDVAECLAAPPD